MIGTLAVTAVGWRFAFVIGAGIAGLAALCVWSAIPAPIRTPVRANTGSARRGPRSTLTVVFAIVALEFTLSFWLASYLHDDIGLTRDVAVAAASGLYAANLAGRLLASRLARRAGAERLLAAALGIALAGLPVLLVATGAAAAAAGSALAGVGIGAMFPLTSSLHVKASPRTADGALGEVLAVASAGQIAGPLTAGAVAQAAGLRSGLITLPVLVLIAVAGLYRHTRRPTGPGTRPSPGRG